MITGKTKRKDTIQIDTRQDGERTLVTLSVIYSTGGGFAAPSESIEAAKKQAATLFGEITWDHS